MKGVVIRGRTAEVVRQMMDGVPLLKIGETLGMTHKTAKGHLHRAYLKADIGPEWIKSVRLVYLVSIGEVLLV